MTKTPYQHGSAGILTREHSFVCPLDYDKPDGETIHVFGREFVARESEGKDLPWLVFFQGGPGFGAPRPADSTAWLPRALEEYRVFMLDQRGTGRSTPVSRESLLSRGDVVEQVNYLRRFRADSIVKDAERIRQQLTLDGEPWTALGQSYGGWCISTYLSFAPDGLSAALYTGGLPPIKRTAEDVYRQTYSIVERKNKRLYERFPHLKATIRRVVQFVRDNEVKLPNGDQLMPRRVQQLGLCMYRASGAEALNSLFESPFDSDEQLTYAFLRAAEQQSAFESHPIFSLLHEAIYTQGPATRWAAERVRAEFPQFNDLDREGILLTGEMIYPWMFEDYRYLSDLKPVAEALAEVDDWSPLYDLAQLNANQVPAAAIVYYEDMAVVREFSLETAGEIQNCKVWITNEYEHDGVRVDGERILNRLLKMVRGEEIFSF